LRELDANSCVLFLLLTSNPFHFWFESSNDPSNNLFPKKLIKFKDSHGGIERDRVHGSDKLIITSIFFFLLPIAVKREMREQEKSLKIERKRDKIGNLLFFFERKRKFFESNFLYGTYICITLQRLGTFSHELPTMTLDLIKLSF
jgi:hypothetical protein